MTSQFVSPDTHDPLTTALMTRVRDTAASSPRSRQAAIGPSEMGHECDRRVTYRLLGAERVNTATDPWPAIVGTAVHEWLADAFRADQRWLVEQRVWMSDGYSGTSDLYDTLTHTVIDHKVLGATAMRAVRNGAIKPAYRAQVHLYGYGWARIGFPVRRVALACYPRGGFLADLHVWSEEYQPDIALAALDRVSRLVGVASVLQLDTYPRMWAHVPATDGPDCTWCPFWRPGAAVSGDGCPGPT